MTTKTTASTRIGEAHERLLAALCAPEGADHAVTAALIRRRVDVMGTALARLVGGLMAQANIAAKSGGRPIRPNRLAELVEDVLAQAEQHAAEIARTAAEGAATETDALVNNPEGWEDSWDRERAADIAAADEQERQGREIDKAVIVTGHMPGWVPEVAA